MMKKLSRVVAVVTVAAIFASSCSSDETAVDPVDAEPAVEAENIDTVDDTSDATYTDADGVTSIEESALADELDALPIADLSDAEVEGLVYMREEEKLAGDVYIAMYELWGLEVFNNIAAAELTHTDAMKALLDRYEIEDPATGSAPGEFTNADLQALYDDLVATGSESLTDALLVGATIEDLDIFDLQALASDNPDIDMVYASLERGSRNHMRAFVKQLDRQGAEYTPSFLTQEQFDEIVNTPTERGEGLSVS